MPAYIIVDVSVLDTTAYEQYKQLTPASIAAYGGKFIVRGGCTEILEGNWQPGRMVVLEFDDSDKAKAWWASEAYATAKAIRQSAAHTNMLLVEGYSV
jgi:uncharacterized protein (DUF1330 family)